MITCRYCGASIPKRARNCFEYYSEIMTSKFSTEEFRKFQIYCVDAHALQHPELHGIKNNFYHLLSLCYSFEFKKEPLNYKDIKFLQQRANSTKDIPTLMVPANRGTMSINTIENISEKDQFEKTSREWAFEVWNTWSRYHDFIREELKLLFSKKK